MDADLRDYERRMRRAGHDVKVVPISLLNEFKEFLDEEKRRHVAILSIIQSDLGETCNPEVMSLRTRSACRRLAHIENVNKQLSKLIGILREEEIEESK